MKIAKIHKQYSCNVRGWCSEKKEVIFLSVLKEITNQHRTLYLDPQREGCYGQSQRNLCFGCQKLYEHSKIYTYRLHTSFKWRMEKDNIDLL